MRAFRWIVIAVAAVIGMAAAGVRAQDVYASEGPWLDDRAAPFRLESLQGDYTVLTMAYGACRRICSTSLRVMEQLQALSDSKQLRLNFVVVGLDPSQDTPKDWADFRRLRKLTRSNWQFLSGDAEATRRFAQRVGVRYWRYGEHTMHDFRIVLVSPKGQVLRAMSSFDDDQARLLP